MFGFLEFASIQMKPRNVQVPDRLLRQLLIRLALTKNALEPAKRLAKVSAKSRGKRQVVRHETNVVFVRKFFSKLQRNAKLLFRLGPLSKHDQAEAPRVGAFHERL